MDVPTSARLSARLAAYMAGPAGSVPAFPEETEACLRELLAAGRDAWPLLPLSDDECLRYIAERIPEGAVLPDALKSIQAADLHLACACVLGKPGALASFERHCLAKLPAVLSRFSTSNEFHDEVRQAVRERLFVSNSGGRVRIEDYGGRGPLAGWVRVVMVRLALDLLRSRGKHPHPVEDDVLQGLVVVADSELGLLVERHGPQVKAAFREAFAALAPRERNLLRLHYLDGLTIDELAVMKRIHRSTVARRIIRCCELLSAHAHRLLVEQLGITDSQVDSLMRLLRSQVDLSLDRWLGGGPAARRI
jgi:RNA polymerase sigma-70 factor (ECF subfamily)